jgi:hypothetical protein
MKTRTLMIWFEIGFAIFWELPEHAIIIVTLDHALYLDLVVGVARLLL